ncbi:putative methyltransferase-domain-containing protein [Fusarium solani]|uniref:Protein-lysine N-methyltransferase EFM6 n=1 Tax=Fusarium solani TaxID=169388 RepID=A0A9P9KPZ1_FUSSL|nr:putative methyltransferase-domain-containing protein [Fusarium solani]KAH7266219.1 putative methyltransferase-domain-containing protein [Fusarium solani]
MSSPPSSPLMDPVAISEDLTPLPTLKAIGVAQVDFDGVLSQSLKLREDVRSGCGGQTWPAGMLLGKHMLRYHRDRLNNARILELGAGGGLVGLAVALECDLQNPLLLTDQTEMFELMQHNIKLNGLQSKAKAMVLNWGEPLPATVLEQKPDVILAGECVYFEPAFPLLMSTLKTLLELNPSAVVYFCFKKRRRADMNFVKMAKKAFKVEEIFDEERPVFQRQGLFLFSFTRRTGQQQGQQKAASKNQGETRLAMNGDSQAKDVSS